MIFVDTNVFMYAVGREHPLRDPARKFFAQAKAEGTPLCSSAEVLQELMHAFISTSRLERLEVAMRLASDATAKIWSIEAADVQLAHTLMPRYAGLSARDLVHLASCRRRDVRTIKTWDRALAAAFE